MNFNHNDDPSVLYSEMTTQSAYENTLAKVREVFVPGGEGIMNSVEAMAPYLAASADLSVATPAEAQVLYSKLSKGYELCSTLHSRAVFDKNAATTNFKALRGKYYLERFPAYVQAMKAKGVVIKDTADCKEHFLNTQEEIISAKEQIDFHEAVETLLQGWKSKLYSDMTTAKNLTYNQRFTGQLSSEAN
jgi:hypothetical protein